MDTNAPASGTARASASLINKDQTSSARNSTGGNQQRNPFYGRVRDNFPSLDRALGTLLDNQQNNSSEHGSSSGSRTDSLDLSMDARAALHEHLRHIAKFGVDGEFAEQGQATADTDASPGRAPKDAVPNNTLDDEWENILQGNLDDSTLPTFDRLQVLNDTVSDNDIEVAVVEMTCIEGDEEDDFFNRSKVWQLMTPEKNRGRRPQAVTSRNDEEYSDEEEGDTTPESACLVETNHPDMKQDKISPLSSSNEDSSEPSPPQRSPSAPPSTETSPPGMFAEAMSPVAAAAAAMAQDLERHPSRLASVALADFLGDDSGLHNSLLSTSVHEDLPLITSPFEPATDLEGSFADWSVKSVENPSFVLPSAVTPIRPLPPLSPIHSLRGSPSSSQRGSNSNSSGSHPNRGSPRSSKSSSSSGIPSWRVFDQESSPQRSDLERGLREEMISPIRPLNLAPTQEEDEVPSEQDSSSPHDKTESLSPLAKRAAQTAVQFLQSRKSTPFSLRPPTSSRWPDLGSADSFETTSTAGMAGEKCQQQTFTPIVKTIVPQDLHKDALTAPLLSLDTVSTTDQSGLRSTRSADRALRDRRRYRTVVPRRIIFPNDGDCNEAHGDSFDRPSQSF